MTGLVLLLRRADVRQLSAADDFTAPHAKGELCGRRNIVVLLVGATGTAVFSAVLVFELVVFERVVVRMCVVVQVGAAGPAPGVALRAAYTRLSVLTVDHVEDHSRIFVIPVIADVGVVALDKTFLVTQRHIFHVMQVKVPSRRE